MCVCVPSSCIMTCSETTRSRSHLPLRAHNRHAGVIMHPAEESVLQHKEGVALWRAQSLDAPKWPHSLSPAEPPLIGFLGSLMVLIKGAKERETTTKKGGKKRPGLCLRELHLPSSTMTLISSYSHGHVHLPTPPQPRETTCAPMCVRAGEQAPCDVTFRRRARGSAFGPSRF